MRQYLIRFDASGQNRREDVAASMRLVLIMADHVINQMMTAAASGNVVNFNEDAKSLFLTSLVNDPVHPVHLTIPRWALDEARGQIAGWDVYLANKTSAYLSSGQNLISMVRNADLRQVHQELYRESPTSWLFSYELPFVRYWAIMRQHMRETGLPGVAALVYAAVLAARDSLDIKDFDIVLKRVRVRSKIRARREWKSTTPNLAEYINERSPRYE